MRGIGQAGRRTLSPAQRRPKGRGRAPTRGVASLDRSAATLLGLLLTGERPAATQTVVGVRNAG